jgi:hypothetical protein
MSGGRIADIEEEISEVREQLDELRLEVSHRGASGRDLNPLPSRIWVVVRDYAGQIYTPVRVFRSWGSCKILVKHFEDVGDSLFCGFPSERGADELFQWQTFSGLPIWSSDG